MDAATALDLAVDHGHRVLHPWDGRVSEPLVALAHDQGVAVNTWTVDDPARMVELAGWGVDGVVTNVPDVARAALGR
jgi:glycerophosphoryl diester phosphodiesterase